MDKSYILSYIPNDIFDYENYSSDNLSFNESEIVPFDKINNTKMGLESFNSAINKKSKLKFNLTKGRKYKEDNIRKKIKTNFHQYMRNNINKNLSKSGSKRLFENFPQNFIADI